VERWIVVVDDALPVAEVEADPEPDAEDDVPPVMWNGKEYWSVVGLESSVISNPYVAKELVVGTLHVYFPRELEMLSISLLVSVSVECVAGTYWR
jgi:hypothetical protein